VRAVLGWAPVYPLQADHLKVQEVQRVVLVAYRLQQYSACAPPAQAERMVPSPPQQHYQLGPVL
jgi:hypothetical protein